MSLTIFYNVTEEKFKLVNDYENYVKAKATAALNCNRHSGNGGNVKRLTMINDKGKRKKSRAIQRERRKSPLKPVIIAQRTTMARFDTAGRTTKLGFGAVIMALIKLDFSIDFTFTSFRPENALKSALLF